MTDAPNPIMAGLTSGNLLIKLGVGALVVFGSLYALDSFGIPGMFGVAVLVAIGTLIARQGAANAGTAQVGRSIKVRRIT